MKTKVQTQDKPLKVTLTITKSEADKISNKAALHGASLEEYVLNSALHTGRKRYKDKVICSIVNDLTGYVTELRTEALKLPDNKQTIRNLDELTKGLTKLCLL